MDYRTALLSPRRLPGRLPRSLVARLESPVEALGFWGAIAMPAGYLPLLASGIEGGPGLALLVSLVALHIAALLVGHGHGRSRHDRQPSGRR